MITEEQMLLFTRWRVRAFGEMLREVCEGERYDHMSFEEKLGLCIDAEREARENRKIERCRRQARFKIRDACVEDTIYSPDRSLAKDRMMRLSACRWVEERENLVIISESGCGVSGGLNQPPRVGHIQPIGGGLIQPMASRRTGPGRPARRALVEAPADALCLIPYTACGCMPRCLVACGTASTEKVSSPRPR